MRASIGSSTIPIKRWPPNSNARCLQAPLLQRAGTQRQTAAAEFLKYARDQVNHADLIALRITSYAASPDFNPDALIGRSRSRYDSSTELEEMIREDSVAESVAIASYAEIITWMGAGGPSTRRMFEKILAMEERHSEDKLAILDGLN